MDRFTKKVTAEIKGFIQYEQAQVGGLEICRQCFAWLHVHLVGREAVTALTKNVYFRLVKMPPPQVDFFKLVLTCFRSHH